MREGDLIPPGLTIGRILHHKGEEVLEHRLSIRFLFGLPKKRKSLYSGRLSAHKRVFILIFAYRVGDFARRHGRWPPRFRCGFFWSEIYD